MYRMRKSVHIASYYYYTWWEIAHEEKKFQVEIQLKKIRLMTTVKKIDFLMWKLNGSKHAGIHLIISK